MNDKTEFEQMVIDPSEIDVAGEYPDADPAQDMDGVPRDFDSEWSEYLLDQLSDHELINGAPTVDGLRRITEKCFWEIVESKSSIV